MPRLVLWDIDGTLLDAAGFGRFAYGRAFAELFGSELTAEVPMAGRTDRAIMVDALAVHGITGPARIAEFQAAVVRTAERHREVLHQRGGRALAGAAAALGALVGRGDVVSSVLTGNLRGLAAAKLGAVGLDRYLDLEVGAYGDHHERRADLVGIARGLARRRYGSPFDGTATVLVGDTPLDVEAALASGAAVIGVATGPYPARELTAAGAPVVFTDLADTAAVLSAVLAGGSGYVSSPG